MAAVPATSGRPQPSSIDRTSTSTSPFQPTVENKAPAPGSAPEGMVWIPGGEFSMGSDDPRSAMCGGPDAMPDARPIHRVYVDGFWMDNTEVTNDQFAQIRRGHQLCHHRRADAADGGLPDAPPENLVAGSTVFTPTAEAGAAGQPFPLVAL